MGCRAEVKGRRMVVWAWLGWRIYSAKLPWVWQHPRAGGWRCGLRDVGKGSVGNDDEAGVLGHRPLTPHPLTSVPTDLFGQQPAADPAPPTCASDSRLDEPCWCASWWW